MSGGFQANLEWPAGGSEMRARIRAFDWSATPLGSINEWRLSLRLAVDLMLGTGFPTLLLWGKELIQISNDAYRRICNKGAPIGIGFAESWPLAWPANAPVIERVWRGETIMMGEAPFHEWQPGSDDDSWYSLSYSPVRDEIGAVAGIWITVIETTERVRAEATLRENEARLEEILELVPVGVSLFDGEGRTIKANPEMARLLEAVDLARADNIPWAILDRDGRRLTKDEFPMARTLRGDPISPETHLVLEMDGTRRWLKVGAVPSFRDGRISGGVVIAHDVTEAKESAERMKVLVAELQHRTRNVIAVVRALADKTLAGSASLDDFGAKYRARLAALARVQGLLSNLNKGDRVTFDALLRAELAAHAAFDDARVALDGPAGVRLRSSSVQTLALALHELATNASKYGALAQPEGRLAVRWRVATGADGERRIEVEWCECGAAMPAEADTRQGYGRELIERVLPYQLQAQTSYQLGPDGVHCAITLRITGGAAA